MRGVKFPTLGVALFCVATPAMSLEKGITAGVNAEWTDNVFLTADDRRNDWRESVTFGANLSDEESFYQYGVDYNLSHDRYQRDSFDPATFYSGTAFLNLSLVPRRFEWYSAVQSETTLLESSAVNTPDNRDQRDMITTSPTLTLLALQRDTVAVSGQATKVMFRESDESDSERVGGDVSWTHAISSLLDVSLTASQQQVDFDAAEDYDTTNYRLGIERRINGGSIELSAGQTTITPELGEEFDGAQYEANINWSREPHTLFFQAYHDLTDSTVGLAGSFDTGGLASPAEVDTGEVELVKRTRYTTGYGYGVTGSFNVTTTLYQDKEEAEDGSSETIRKGVGILAVREMTPEMRAGFEFNFERYDSTDFEAVVVSELDYTRRYRLNLERDFFERLRAELWLQREESDRELDVASYEQHAVGASLEFTF